MTLLVGPDYSVGLVKFCIENYKKNLPFFSEAEGQLYLENLDFLLRFWKKENYYTRPSITFTGTQNPSL